MNIIRTSVVVSCFLLAFWPGQADAQRRYEPRRPTFSRYHDLFRSDNGLLDPYSAQIVPRRRAAQQFSRMQSTIDQQAGDIKSLNQQVLQLNRSVGSPTGKGGGFMTHHGYFGGGSRR